MIEMSSDTCTQTQAATEDGEEDPNSKREKNTEEETIWNSCGRVEQKVHEPRESS